MSGKFFVCANSLARQQFWGKISLKWCWQMRYYIPLPYPFRYGLEFSNGAMLDLSISSANWFQNLFQSMYFPMNLVTLSFGSFEVTAFLST
jgi:hypothetical protein